MTSADRPAVDETTPLHLAAKKGHLEICRLIMEHDDVEEPDDKNPVNLEGYTPLHYAVQGGHTGTAPHNHNLRKGQSK